MLVEPGSPEDSGGGNTGFVFSDEVSDFLSLNRSLTANVLAARASIRNKLTIRRIHPPMVFQMIVWIQTNIRFISLMLKRNDVSGEYCG